VGALAAGSLVGADPAAADQACQTQTYPQVDPKTIPWAQTRLDFQRRVWPITEGEGVNVAVIDSGVDASNAQLSGVENGGDTFTPGGSGLVDSVGHGTMVAGIIAAHPIQPTIGFVGVAPRAHLISVKAAEAECTSNAYAVAEAIKEAMKRHAAVINISIAVTADVPALANAVSDAVAAGVIIVAAAGNDAGQGNAPVYPASYPGVLAVASIDQSGARSAFSSTGTVVSVAAPGSDIVSTGAGVNGPYVVGGTSAQGTSFAAPYVAGVAALVIAAHPSLSGRAVVRRIEATADHLSATADRGLGWGVVDPYAAVTAILPGETGVRTAVPTATAIRAPLPVADPGEGTATQVADVIALGAVAAAAAIAGIAVGVAAARRRGWRAGRWSGRTEALR
jgi:type VII secretion-associated serine protease mycosin